MTIHVSGPWSDGNDAGGGDRPPGGGPWGQKPDGPRRPPPPRPEMPDFDATIARAKAAFDRVFTGRRQPSSGGGGGSGGPSGPLGRRVPLYVAVALGLLWLSSGFYRVEPNQMGVVLRFGALNRTSGPGLGYHFPWPIETVLVPLVTTINRTEIGYRTLPSGAQIDSGRDARGTDVLEESLMLTGDENIIDIDASVFWKIADPAAYLFTIDRPDATIKAVAESAMREVIGRTPIQPALTELRAQIELAVQRETQAILDSYHAGVQITQVQLQKVDPPAEVIDSFRDVQRANTEAETARNEAEAFHNDIVPRARGDAARIVAQADGGRQALVASARGETQRFLSVLSAYQTAKEVTLRRLYVETMQDVLSKNPSLIVDNTLRGIVPYLPLNPEVTVPTAPRTAP